MTMAVALRASAPTEADLRGTSCRPPCEELRLALARRSAGHRDAVVAGLLQVGSRLARWEFRLALEPGPPLRRLGCRKGRGSRAKVFAGASP